MLERKNNLSGAPDRILKISWTYYGLLLRLIDMDSPVRRQVQYTITHRPLREYEDDPELFAATLQVLEEKLHKDLDDG